MKVPDAILRELARVDWPKVPKEDINKTAEFIRNAVNGSYQLFGVPAYPLKR